MTRPDAKDIMLRILDISYRHKLSHLGSVFSCLPILLDIYSLMDKEDKVILSAGHCGLAQYVILEALGYGDAEEMLEESGIHPDTVLNNLFEEELIHASTGSLGQGLPIALGRAIANPEQAVYCVISDGECYEGSIWEALRIKDDLKVNNLKVYVNMNGYSAYSAIDKQLLEMRIKMFDYHARVYMTNSEPFVFLKGIDAHYHVMNEQEYELAKQVVKDMK